MKASEVLAKYAAGERNFQRVNLRGQSFKGKNLAGADFSEADLRSTNFTEATLTGANFTGAKCGLQKRWATVLTVLSLLLAGVSGFFSVYAALIVSLIFNSDLQNQIIGSVGLLILIVFLVVTICRGIRASVLAIAAIEAVVAVIAVLIVVTLAETSGASPAGALSVASSGVYAVLAVVASAVTLAGASAAVVVIAALIAAVLAVVVAIVVSISVVKVVAAAVVIIGVCAGWRAMKGDPKDAWIRSFAIALAAIKGTSFRNADLTDANFSSARLKSTDMRGANLTRVRWHKAKMLDRVRPGKTYLQSTQVRQWLIGKGVDKNFDGQKLQGVNFQGADLTDASFIDANLSEANLQDADLSRAKLVQTQLDRTDLTGANLTGAFIEDWGITSNTVLQGVKCEYIFMRLPTQENPEPCRKPDNRQEVFKDGDFGDFIKPIFDTLDLYHNQEVDPRAIAISWKQLAENNPDAKLQFASMEVKGENQDHVLLRLKAKANADLSQLSADYFETYNQIKALTAAEYKKLIAAQDNRIQALESMVNTALKRPGFYAETYNHQGDKIIFGEQRKIDLTRGNYNEQIEGNYVQDNKTNQSRNLNNSGTINNSGAGAFNLGDLSGTVAKIINKLPTASNSDEPGIKELLTQLQAAVADPQLSTDDQKQVLEQIEIIATAGQNPQEQMMQKKAVRAVGFLKVIAKEVEPASQLAKACATALPQILAFFV